MCVHVCIHVWTSNLFHYYAKVPDENNQKGQRLVWLTIGNTVQDQGSGEHQESLGTVPSGVC